MAASPLTAGFPSGSVLCRLGSVGTHLGERLVCLQRLRELVLDPHRVAQSTQKVFSFLMGDFILLQYCPVRILPEKYSLEGVLSKILSLPILYYPLIFFVI